MRTHLDKVIVPLAMALDPDSCKVDERDHRDRLAFVAEVAKLFLYYDKTNQLAGDWHRFFLKDPAILMAAISKADPVSYYAAPDAQKNGSDDTQMWLVSQLFVLSTNLFVLLDQWFHLMSHDAAAYVLHAFLKVRIEDTLAEQLWTMTTLQQVVSIRSKGRIEPPDSNVFNRFEPVWHDQNNRMTRQETYAADLEPGQTLSVLKQVYDAVFDVFTQVVTHAEQAFNELQDKATRFPDTALLMVFSRLMETQQREINLIGRKHLDFYYQRVLQQDLKQAHDDQAYVFLTLAPNADALNLPAGTPFKAGTYTDGSDIIFVNDQKAQINRAAVTQVKALYYSGNASGGGLYVSTVTDASQLVRNATQEVRYWDAFGNAQGVAVQQGFAIASPMLLVQGGARTITLGLQLSTSDAPSSFLLDPGTSFYLSTEKAWLRVTPTVPVGTDTNGFATLTFDLTPSDPAIVAFKHGPDGVSSPWPQFKVLLGALESLTRPPTLSAVSITVEVDGLSQLVIANDNAVLPTTGAVPLFGPAPELGQNLYVGSNECFAKPLTSFGLTIDWDHLPADFAAYYGAYNDYLMAGPPAERQAVFSNSAFKVDWQRLQNKSWQPLLAAPGLPTDPKPSYVGTTALFQPNVAPTEKEALPATLADSSTFTFSVGSEAGGDPAPNLALSSLPPVAQASQGYLRLKLSAPTYAFGQSLYAKVVMDIGLRNAQVMVEKAKAPPNSMFAWLGNLFQDPDPEPAILGLPSLPFSPKKLGVTARYTATCMLDIASPRQEASYPFALYHYGSFLPYLAYDAQSLNAGYGFSRLTPKSGDSDEQLPLYPGVAGPGSLYVALGQVVTPCTLNLFVEILADDNLPAAGNDAATCYCWTATGWQPLLVLHDDTRNLSRTGIIKLELPATVSGAPAADGLSYTVSPIMPGNDFWLAIDTPNTGRNVRVSYLNTQAIKLRRSNVVPVPQGVTPVIDANTLVSTQQKMPLIASVTQPFPSFGGRPSEKLDSFDHANSFYRRVSLRLNHKGRASSRSHYVDLAHDACAGLYYVRLLDAVDDEPGAIRIGLVNGYADAQLPDAFMPVVSGSDQQTVQQYLARRVSAMARICVQNLLHQVIRVEVQLVASPEANRNTLTHDLNQQLKLYFSPWIASDLPQMDITQGLSRSELIGVINGHPDVLAVSALKVWLTPAGMDSADEFVTAQDPLLPDADAILVTAAQHTITLAPIRQLSTEASHD